MSVFDNVALGLAAGDDLSDDDIAERVREALAVVGLTGGGAEVSGPSCRGDAQARGHRARHRLRPPATCRTTSRPPAYDPVTSAVIDSS